MRRVFISHNRADNVWCEDFYKRLQRKLSFMRLFMDTRNLPPGAQWNQHLWQVFNTCSAYLIVVSRNAASSNWVKDEAKEAIAWAKKDPTRLVIPVLIDDISNLYQINPDLAQYQAADFRDGTKYDETLARVVYALKHPDRQRTQPGAIVQVLPPVPLWIRAVKQIINAIGEGSPLTRIIRYAIAFCTVMSAVFFGVGLHMGAQTGFAAGATGLVMMAIIEPMAWRVKFEFGCLIAVIWVVLTTLVALI